MPEPRTCPKCGTALPPDAPEGACPRCLLAAGLEGSDAGGGASPPVAPTPEEIGRHFPNLEVLELLGQGGMGIVYKARQRNLDRFVALKVLPPEVAREKNFAERFTREARTLARLHHAHIVGVHDFGESDGLFYLVMEFVDGPNLRQLMKEKALGAKEALAIVPQICDALQFAHDHGVVHRDIKPENVLLDRAGNVKIADFGLAKLVQRTPVELTITRTGQVMGTLHYMAPEQYRNPDGVDHRADIYSLGVVFYEMLTGELPMGRFEPPSHTKGVDVRLDDVVMRSLEKERDRRFQKVSEVRTRIDSISAEPAPAGAKPPVVAARGGGSAAAPAPAPAAGTPPDPVPFRGEPRLSRLAVAGVLAIPAAVLVGVVPALASGGAGSGTLISMAVAGLLAATGVVLSIAGWISIRHSGGRLHGVGWAATGVFLPLVLCCGGSLSFPFLFLASAHEPGPLGIHDGPDGTRVSFPGVEIEDGPRGTRVRVPGVDIDTRRGAPLDPALDPPPPRPIPPADHDASLKVLGGPASLDDAGRAAVLAGIEEQWRDAWGYLGETNAAVLASHLATADRARYEAMGTEERDGEKAWSRLGMLFVNPMVDLASPLADFRVHIVHLSGDGRSARVVRSTGNGTLAYPLVRDGNSWRFALGKVEQMGRAPEEGDSDGWIDNRYVGGGRDPAERVSGGPEGRAAWERERDIEYLRREWWREGAHWTSAQFPDLKDGGGDSRFRPYHLSLDPAGDAGRLVLCDGTITLSLPVRREPDGWTLGETDFERRNDPAKPSDRDGRLLD